MKQVKLTKARKDRFLKALADTGSVTTAVAVAGTSRTRVYEQRKKDTTFAAAWDDAEEIATDRLEHEARRRAIEGVAEPVVSAGKLVRGDDGQPIMVKRYSDNLLMALLKARRLPGRDRSVRFQLPALRSAADAASAMSALTAAVAAGEVTPGEAAALSKLVETYVRALEAHELEQRLRVVEEKPVQGKLEHRLRAIEARTPRDFDIWVEIGNGRVRGALGEEIPYGKAEALSHAAGRFPMFMSEVDSRL
jgi:hypothetical protein